tara:strand:+ start:343 stop:579 length:237 start_codon:yes stop_codon:yes gene_type:complete
MSKNSSRDEKFKELFNLIMKLEHKDYLAARYLINSLGIGSLSPLEMQKLVKDVIVKPMPCKKKYKLFSIIKGGKKTKK